MNELLKTIIPPLLSWPVALVVVALIFRKPLHRLWSLMMSVAERFDTLTAKYRDAEIQARLSPREQTQELAETTATVSLTQTAEVFNDKTIAEWKKTLLAEGIGVEAIELRVTNTTKFLSQLRLDAQDPDTFTILIRALASQAYQAGMEKLYRQIFGSQITALDLLNQRTVDRAELLSLYQNAVAKYPAFYASYAFDDWLNFLERQSLIAPLSPEATAMQITVAGRGFLLWRVQSGVSAEKPG